MIRNILALAALATFSLSTVACMAPTGDAETPGVEETSQDLVSRSAYFETFEGLDGQFYFHLLAANGENLLRSEGYTTLAAAEHGAEAVLAVGSHVDAFEVLEAQNGDHYFHVKAGNGEIVGTSELYATRSNAERGARTVRALVRLSLAAAAKTRPAVERARFELFTGEDRQTYFHLRAGNGEIVLGSEGYTSKQSAQKGVASVRANGTAVAHFRISEAQEGTFGVRLVAANGEVIARGETYASRANAERAVARMSEMLATGELPVEQR